MPRIPIDADNKQASALDFPRLKFVAGERARIVCLEDPLFEYIHDLRAPTIIDGRPVMETVTNRDGQAESRMKFDFIGRPICLGDVGTLIDKGADTVHCPVCEMAKTSDVVSNPVRRFAMHVIKYGTVPGGFDLRAPFVVETVVWAFNDTTFNKLADFRSEWGDLHTHDLMLGPCTNVQFQKIDIAVASRAAWLSNEETKRFTAQTFKGSQAPDLSVFCGRRSDRAFLLQDLARVAERSRLAFGTPGSVDPALAVVGAGVGVDDLLSQQAGEVVPAADLDLDAILGNTPSSVPAPVALSGWAAIEELKASVPGPPLPQEMTPNPITVDPIPHGDGSYPSAEPPVVASPPPLTADGAGGPFDESIKSVTSTPVDVTALLAGASSPEQTSAASAVPEPTPPPAAVVSNTPSFDDLLDMLK